MLPTEILRRSKNDDGFIGLLKGDWLDSAFADYKTSDKGRQASQLLNEKQYSIKETDETYRTINHWSSVGLVDDDEKSRGKGWRNFSLIDLVWIAVIAELRNFGFPLKNIRVTKEFLFSGKKTESKSSLFELYIALALMRRPVCLLVFSDGKCEPALQGEVETNQAFFGDYLPSFIRIDLNKIVQRIIGREDLKANYEDTIVMFKLDKKELLVFQAIRDGKAAHITIRFKDGKVDMLEATDEIDPKKRVIDVLREGKYQTIEVKQTDGKVVSVKRTHKQKL